MKRIITLTIAFLITLIITYLIGAFIGLSFDFIQWSEGLRAFMVLLMPFIAFVISIFYNNTTINISKK